MKRGSWLAWGMVACTLITGGEAWSSARKLPKYDLTTDKGMKKAVKTFAYTTEGKVWTFPKKIAIPYFQIRYRFGTDQKLTHSAYSLNQGAHPSNPLVERGVGDELTSGRARGARAHQAAAASASPGGKPRRVSQSSTLSPVSAS